MKSIQVRHVPDAVHRKLKSRAALEGISLSEYLLRELRSLAERPTVAEFRETLSRRTSVEISPTAAEILREERDQR